MQVSILISSYNRLPLFRRSLWAIATKGPSVPFEVVVCDDGSDEDILGLLQGEFAGAFPWVFIKTERSEFEEETGLKKFHNCPALTNNIAFKHAKGDILIQQGNEVIPWGRCYDEMLADLPDTKHAMVMSTTYDLRQESLDKLDQYGSNLTAKLVEAAYPYPLQSEHYRSDVTNYISLTTRSVWEEIGGYDETYYAGISAEDSDFVRRARTLPGFAQVISEGVSLHQYHGGRTAYYWPKASVISVSRFNEGCAINRVHYDRWDGTKNNPQKWPMGSFGIKEVITNQ